MRHRRGRRAAAAGAEQRVHHQLGIGQRGGQHGVVLHHARADRAALHLAVLEGGIAPQLVRAGDQEDLHAMAGALEPARDDETIATVATLAAHDGHPHATPPQPQPGQRGLDPLGGAAPRVLHQRRPRNAQLADRALIHPTHLVRREHRQHAYSATINSRRPIKNGQMLGGEGSPD